MRDRDSLTEQIKKKRNSDHHIVIPSSVAATTRVETIKYKEIQIPSWKEVERTVSLPKAGKEGEQEKEVNKEQKEQDKQEEEEEESTSDLMYQLMHAKGEEEERARWAAPQVSTWGMDTVCILYIV